MNTAVIVIGGIPGTGKSTLANALSKDINIPVFSKDDLEAAIARKGLCSSKNMDGVGYEIMATLAESQIGNCNSAIFDFIASKARVNDLWPKLLKTDIKYIECICSDEGVHKERVQTRKRNLEGWYELTWEDILSIKINYQPLKSDRLIIDSINNLSTNIERAKEYVFQ